MITYQYKAIGADGKPTRGVVQAADEYGAVQMIRQTCPIITEISEVKETKGSFLTMEIGGKAKITSQKLALLCSQFAIMLKSGIPIARCISLIAEQTGDKKLRKILENTADDVSGGSSVAASFERNGKGAFPATFIETVRAGEQAGTIENSFEKMQAYYERSYKTREKIKQAMTYPIFVVIVAIIVLIIVMAKVIPTLAQTFSELGGDLPVMTQIMIAISNFFAKWWILMLIVILGIIVFLGMFFRTERGALIKGKMLLKMPVLGKINTMTGAAQFADTMSVMLGSGLTVNKAIEVTAKVLDNEVLRREVASVQGRVEEGRPLGECIQKIEHFPDALRQMTSIGEETGELDATLATIGEYYDNEADHLTQQALNKLEPTMLIILAVFAGFIVISIYLPMFTMYNLM